MKIKEFFPEVYPMCPLDPPTLSWSNWLTGENLFTQNAVMTSFRYQHYMQTFNVAMSYYEILLTLGSLFTMHGHDSKAHSPT